jgi:hypothetical protein
MAITDRRGVSVSAVDTPVAGDPNPGLAWKAPARVATTGSNIVLSGLQTVDGVSLAAGNRVLVKDQTDQTTNGLYNASTGAWTRTVDADNSSQWGQGLQILVALGTTNAGRTYAVSTADPITVGTTAIVFGTASEPTGGSKGQILVKNSPTSGDASWYDSAFNIETFGGGVGVADNGPALRAAINAMPSTGGAVYFPAAAAGGQYTFQTGVIINKPCLIRGSGRFVTTIVPTFNGNVFDIEAQGVSIRDLYIKNGQTMTSGAFIYVNSIRATIQNVKIDGAYGGIQITGNGTFTTCRDIDLRNITPASVAPGSFGIGLTGIGSGSEDVVLDNIQMDIDTPTALPSYGLLLSSCDAFTAVASSFIHAVNCIGLVPGAGQSALSSKIIGCFFDSGTNAVTVGPSGTGNVVRIQFLGCWIGDQSSCGAFVDNQGTGTVADIEFIECQGVNNGSDGILINSANVTDIAVRGGVYAQNGSAGIAIAANVNEVLVSGAKIGAYAGMTANQYGIYLSAGTGSKIQLVGNAFKSNAVADIQGWSGLTGGNNKRSGNLPDALNDATTVVDGGTGLATLTAHAVLIGQGTSPLTFAATGTAGQLLIDQGPGIDPAFQPLSGDASLAANGALTIGANAITNAKFRQSAALSVVGNAGAAVANVADIAGTANQVLRVNSGGTALGFGALNLAASAAVTGTLPSANGGTDNAAYAVGDLLYASAVTPTLSRLAAVAIGAVLSSAGVGVAPAWSTTPQVGALGVGSAANGNIALTIGGTLSGQSGEFGIYMGGLTLSPNTGGNAYFQYAGGGTIGTGAGNAITAGFGILVAPYSKSGTGSVSVAYGGFFDAQSIGSTNWSIWAAGDVNLATKALCPLIIGGSATSSTLTIESTSGAGTSDSIVFKTGSQSTRLTLTSAGSIVLGSGAIATTATDGFLYIPTCAGPPTGVPTAQTGRVAIVYDTTDHKLYIYDGAWKGGTAPGVWS